MTQRDSIESSDVDWSEVPRRSPTDVRKQVATLTAIQFYLTLSNADLYYMLLRSGAAAQRRSSAS